MISMQPCKPQRSWLEAKHHQWENPHQLQHVPCMYVLEHVLWLYILEADVHALQLQGYLMWG